MAIAMRISQINDEDPEKGAKFFHEALNEAFPTESMAPTPPKHESAWAKAVLKKKEE